MKYSKKEIGEELKRELDKGYDVIRISNWAHNLFFYSREDFTVDVSQILQYIFIMDAGPEFEYTEKELRLLAELLINEVEDPIKQINEMKAKKSD
jgi:hypothetical protein